jgi:hypothetical protein
MYATPEATTVSEAVIAVMVMTVVSTQCALRKKQQFKQKTQQTVQIPQNTQQQQHYHMGIRATGSVSTFIPSSWLCAPVTASSTTT